MPRHHRSLVNRRRLLLTAAALVTLTACTAPQPPLRLGSIVFTGYEPVFLARELGLLDNRQVRLVELASSTDTLRALASQQLEAAQLTLDEFILARANGLDLRVIAVLDRSVGADAVIARPDLKDINRIKGLRVAVEEGAVGALMLSAFLKHHNLKPADITKVPYTLDRSLASFEQGRADLFVTATPWIAPMVRKGGQNIFDSAAIPNRIVDVMVARGDVLKPYDLALKHVVQAHFTAVARFIEAPQAVAPLMAKRLQVPPVDVPAAFEGLVLPDAATSLADLQPNGPLFKAVQNLMTMMVAEGLLRQPLPLDTLFDTRFHPHGQP